METYNKLLEFIFQNSIIDATVNKMTGVVVMVAITIATILYFITLAHNYIKSSVSSLKDQSSNSFVDYEDLARTLVIIGAIVVYLPLINITTETIEFLNKFTAPGRDEYKVMEQYAETYNKSGQTYAIEVDENVMQSVLDDPNSSSDLKQEMKKRLEGKEKGKIEVEAKEESSYLSLITSLINKPGEIWNLIFHGITMVLLGLIKLIIYAITTNVLKVLIIIGPLAFAFSILPAFKNQINIWAGTYLNVAFVFTTLNILDAIIITSMEYLSEGNSVSISSPQANMAFAMTQIIMYLSCFWLTSKFIGKADGGMALTKMVGMAAAATAMVITGGAAAGAMAGGGVTNVGTAASVASDVTKQQ